MVIGARPKLDLLDRYGDLFLLCFVSFLFLLIKKLAVVNDLCHRRLSVWSDLDQIDTSLSCLLNSITRIHDAEGFTLISYDANRGNPNALVRPVQRFTLTRPEITSTKSSSDISS